MPHILYFTELSATDQRNELSRVNQKRILDQRHSMFEQVTCYRCLTHTFTSGLKRITLKLQYRLVLFTNAKRKQIYTFTKVLSLSSAFVLMYERVARLII